MNFVTLENLDKDGVYLLTHKINRKIYVGKTKNTFAGRLSNYHGYTKTLPKNPTYITRAVHKYGFGAFDFDILEICENMTNDEILDHEAAWICVYDATNRDVGYNICSRSTDRTGVKSSEETKKKQSQARIGMKFSDEHKLNLRLSHLGHVPVTERAVKQINPENGEVITIWKNMHIASLSLCGTINMVSNICCVCHKRPNHLGSIRKKVGGFCWEFVD